MSNSKRPYVEVIIVDQRGSGPSLIGARAKISSSGIYQGTVGGGKVEAKAIELALELIAEKSNQKKLVKWNLQKDIGMTCGGEVSLFFDCINPYAWEIAVFGAGHVSQALVPLLCTLDCQVTCIDSRSDWLSKIPDFKNLVKIEAAEMADEVEKLSEKSWLLSLTMGHSFDTPILLKSYQHFKELPYRGVIGSAQKAQVIKSELREKGVSLEQLESLHCPLGLPIGNNTPAEIAISISAQLLSLNNSADRKNF
ncbi:MAG: xanthine dehydrogenase accessory protein XdhC [Halobacteriovoraceae bacterium]|nr:xanthine dehydrogenase accessory protein XdhC [Halobacteriovoraceae bacterium]